MKRLLLCTDGSAYGQVCCEYAAWLGRRVPSELEVLYVTDLRQFEVPMIADLGGSLGLQPYHDVLGKLQELEDAKAHAVLADAERCLKTAGFPGAIKLTHVTGFLADRLGEFERQVDFVFIGKRGQNANFATGHLGSTMERAVRSAVSPCFVTSRAFKPIERVLLAYDGGRTCRKAVEHLISSPALRGLELHVVTVAQRNSEETALARLREAESALAAAGYAPICQMLHGAVEDEISAYVETHAIGCLVMGAYGHSRIRHLVIGSTTTALMRECRVPVLVFR